MISGSVGTGEVVPLVHPPPTPPEGLATFRTLFSPPIDRFLASLDMISSLNDRHRLTIPLISAIKQKRVIPVILLCSLCFSNSKKKQCLLFAYIMSYLASSLHYSEQTLWYFDSPVYDFLRLKSPESGESDSRQIPPRPRRARLEGERGALALLENPPLLITILWTKVLL